jgi:acetoacetyl-CoA synthetase
MGVKPGDRVVAYMPNLIETIVAMLAATSLGAVWASCGLELGPKAVLDRFGQIEPKVIFVGSGYFYKGKAFDTLPNVTEVVNGLPSVERTILVPYAAKKTDPNPIPNAVYYDDFLSSESGLEIEFEQLPSEHPVEILFSSGTTGKPKCIVHGIAGTLIAHLKTHVLHYDLKRDDTTLFIASPTWMVWNVQASCLGVGSTAVLYEGNPFYPDAGALWKIVQDEKVTFLGCSAAFIDALRNKGIKPKELYDLTSLRGIFQTGSALSDEGFEYVYQAIKDDVYFDSGLGGTDIQCGLAEGNPLQAVYTGQMMGPGLGMKVNVYDDAGKPIVDKRGELVCEKPFPSVPLYFLNDPGGEKLKEAYFSVYPNVWRHGDYAMIHSDTGGMTAFGRSDSVLKPSGVRIGALEIYNVIVKLDEIADSLVVGQNWQGDQRIILFVKLPEGKQLDEQLKEKIKSALRTSASPRHVPAKIIEVPDIPYTLNMKKVESAVGNIVNGRPVMNKDALINPESLKYYEKIAKEELQS